MTAEWLHYVNDEVQSSDAATYRVELPNRGALHTILLKAQCTNGATAGRAVSMFDVVDDVKVVGDGSEIIYSLTPEEIEKWHECLHGMALTGVQNEAASAVQEFVLPLMFGREVYDPSYFLPLERFKDVKLEVSYSPSIAADGGFATGTTTFDVELLMTMSNQGLNYAGTLKTRRINTFTSVASGDQEVELPDNLDIRAIGVYAYEAAVADGTDVTRVVLEDKSTGKKLFDADWDDFIHINRELFGSEVSHTIRAFLQDTETLNTRIGEILGLDVTYLGDVTLATDLFELVRVDTITGDRLTFNLSQVDVTAGAEDIVTHAVDEDVLVTVHGKSPSYFGLIPFMYQDVREAYLRTANYGKPTVILTQGGAGATCYVSIQEAKSY